ncbi:MAG: effector binding domain-containing protein [Paenibacillaceae bacterium]|nr:effector binding domain-containing protein [Paenibacillaceae bacterium]
MAKEQRSNQETIVTDIRVEMKPPLRITGQAIRTSNAQQAKDPVVPRLMFDFMATRVHDIADRVNPHTFYGILDLSGESYDSDWFTWIAAVEVAGANEPPAGLLSREYPAMLYAVVTCGAMVPVSVYTYMYREWMPNSGYDSAARYAIQYHGPLFRGVLDADSKVEVWFPICPKQEPAASAGQGDRLAVDPPPSAANVPDLLYDGADIDVLWDGHDDAVRWYGAHLGWNVRQQESWKPDPRVSQGRMTHLDNGVWLESVLTSERLPYHYAERGTVDPHVKWCWRTKHLDSAYDKCKQDGIRVSAIAAGPDARRYFDLWCTAEGARITILEDPKALLDGFRDAEIRIGVRHLEAAAQWYRQFAGMKLIALYPDKGYALLTLGVNHKPGRTHTWLLEQLPADAFQGKVDSVIRPRCFIENRETFFAYHRFLRGSGVPTGDFGGFVQRGYVKFHFYDPDGNRFNVCTF